MLVFSNLAEPLDDPCGTLGFRGTPVEKHCTSGRQLKEDKPAMSWLNFLEGLLGTAKKSYGKDDSIFQLPILLEK